MSDKLESMPQQYDYKFPPLKLYVPSVMIFGLGCAFHLVLIQKRNPYNIRPFGIGWGTFGALCMAPHPIRNVKHKDNQLP